MIQRRLKSSAPLDPVLVRYAGAGEEFVLHGEEVTEDEGRALVAGKTRSALLEPVVLQTIAGSPGLSGRALHEKIQATGVKVAKKTVDSALKSLKASARIAKHQDGYSLAGPLVPCPATP